MTDQLENEAYEEDRRLRRSSVTLFVDEIIAGIAYRSCAWVFAGAVVWSPGFYGAYRRY
jgi:hypothetical protein